MFAKISTAAFIALTILFTVNTAAQAKTGFSQPRYASAQLTQVVRQQFAPAPYRLRPAATSHRQPRMDVQPRATGCAWAAFQQCQNERARGKNVICYYPSN